jgi:aryl-alcohol dehydrogenase-like predicted oxidoreductase
MTKYIRVSVAALRAFGSLPHAQVAKKIGVSDETIRRWRKAHNIASTRELNARQKFILQSITSGARTSINIAASTGLSLSQVSSSMRGLLSRYVVRVKSPRNKCSVWRLA